ncbi:MAG: methyltransferase domain-containing protein [Candidatus Obscuribacterales bacterium]|nr:methyltransferase domain-containing protein [Candidatus Obscuribacterales bacterium]
MDDILTFDQATSAWQKAKPNSELCVPAKQPSNLLSICWQQWLTERRLAARGINFRTADPKAVAAAYSAMTAEEFDAINGRQAWANWRTISRCLVHVPRHRPLRVVDLGCGGGSSTQVLAHHCPLGSQIIGYEFSESIIEIARKRNYVHSTGTKVQASFNRQGIAETWRESVGLPLRSQSVDLVNASGVIGHHMTPDTMAPVICELKRVLAPEGIVMLDVGPTMSPEQLVDLMSAVGYRFLEHCCSSWFDPYGQLVFSQKL